VQNGRQCYTAIPASRPRINTPTWQLVALKNAGCEIVCKDDGISGATRRPALLRCLKKIAAGDTLIVWKLNRLGRSLRDLITMLDDLKHLSRRCDIVLGAA
jgi:DNA invertase Pin-like site-specific DNA recombinase